MHRENIVNLLRSPPPHLCREIRINFQSVILPVEHAGGDDYQWWNAILRSMAICFLSTAAFLVLASVAKLRPNLDEEQFDLPALEKLQKLASTQRAWRRSLDRASDHRRTILFDTAPPGQSEQASGPKASAPVPYTQATHDLSSRGRSAAFQGKAGADPGLTRLTMARFRLTPPR
jgi:hypothetical protein